MSGQQYHRDIELNKLVVLHRNHIKKCLKNHGTEVTKQLEKVVTTGKRSGRVYIYRGVPYQSSAPGEPPANRSGRLAKSFVSKARVQELVIGSTAFSKRGAPYPFFLEEGTKKMKPRPYFVNTIESLHYQLHRDLKRI